MVPHPKENPEFNYSFNTEKQALLNTKVLRNIPAKTNNKLLCATWNLTNFGLQNRSDDDIKLMAEVVSWFDLIAIQEISDSLEHLRKLLASLPDSYDIIISDIGGNDERAGFIYDSDKVLRLEMAAEVAVPPGDHRNIRLKGVSGAFEGFDRNPYVVAFKAGNLEFMAVSVHFYFGSNSYFNEDRRELEAYALARWAENRHTSTGAYSNNILIMGDMNLSKRDSQNNVYRALKAKGLILPEHSTALMGSNLGGDCAYDQIAFHSGNMNNAYTGNSGVFDFDHTPFFNDAWNISSDYFEQAVKYHIADHRPLWMEFNI